MKIKQCFAKGPEVSARHRTQFWQSFSHIIPLQTITNNINTAAQQTSNVEATLAILNVRVLKFCIVMDLQKKLQLILK